MRTKALRLAHAALAGAASLVLASPAVAQTTVEYYHTDAIGSVRVVTDAAGNLLRQHDYWPFGAEVNPPPGECTDVRDPLGFTGQERDKETCQDYFGGRYYRSGTVAGAMPRASGRFTSPDPGNAGADILNPQSWNAYSYALNNPLRFVDPSGLCSQDSAGNYSDGDGAGKLVSEGPCKRIDGALAVDATESVSVTGNAGTGQFAFDHARSLFGASVAFLEVLQRGNPDVMGATPFGLPGLARGTTLARTMQSEAGVAQLLAGGGETFAGAGTNVPIKDIARLVSQYGGKASDWAKITSTTPGLQTHAYRNIVTGAVVELKSKIPSFR